MQQYAIRNTQYAIRNTQYAIRNTQVNKYAFSILFLLSLTCSNIFASSCGDAVFTYTVTPPNFAIQVVNLPPQFTDMKVDCNVTANTVCATSLNVTDSTVVLDNTVPGQYTNLNDYNFLRSNKSIFPTFDNEFVITPTQVGIANFGIATAISGDGSTLAIGATNGLVTGIASVDIYRRKGNSWLFAQHINKPITPASGFGASISLSYDGSILAIGSDAVSNSIALTNIANIACIAIYEYNHNTNTYNLMQLMQGSNTAAFGGTVALSATGQYLITNEGLSVLFTGANGAVVPAVYVYSRSNSCATNCGNQTEWELQARLTASENNGTSVKYTSPTVTYFSQTVAISADGSTIAFGIPTRTDPSSTPIGAVAIFRRSGSVWRQTQLIQDPNLVSGTGFGIGVALSGDGKYLAVNAVFDAGGVNGACYMLEQHGSTYTFNATFVYSNSPYAGAV